MALENLVERLRVARRPEDVVAAVMDGVCEVVPMDGVGFHDWKRIDARCVKQYFECMQSGEFEDPLTRTALEAGRAVQARSFMTDPRFRALYREAAQPWGYEHIAMIPVVLERETIALKCFRKEGAPAFSDQELLELMSLSLWASAALRRTEREAGSLRPSLTPRQREICELLCKGLTNREIAGILRISENTIKAHLKEIFLQNGISRRAELAGLLRE